MNILKAQVLIIAFLAIFLSHSIHSQCLVDGCKTCNSTTVLLCQDCKDGHYLRTFTGGSKTYNACWKTWKMIVTAIASIIGALLLCLCCYLARQKGLKDRMRPGSQYKTYITEPEYIEQPYHPQPVIARVYESSPKREIASQTDENNYVKSNNSSPPVVYSKVEPPVYQYPNVQLPPIVYRSIAPPLNLQPPYPYPIAQAQSPSRSVVRYSAPQPSSPTNYEPISYPRLPRIASPTRYGL